MANNAKALEPNLDTEKSFPFSGGGADQNTIDESRWSFMASNWQGDCVIGPYVAGKLQEGGRSVVGMENGYPGDDSLRVRNLDSGKVSVLPGTAIVRGFYYQNTDERIIDLSTEQAGLNPGQKQVVTVGLQLRMDKNWVAVDIRLGTPATGAAPKSPEINDNTPGGNWFMPLADVTISGDTKNIETPFDRRQYRMSNIYTVGDKANILDPQAGSLTYEAYGKQNTERLWFRSLNEWSLIMELGRYRNMDNSQVQLIQSGGSLLPASIRNNFDCRMKYKWISPCTVTFSIFIKNKTNRIIDVPGLGFRLPASHTNDVLQVFQAVLRQDQEHVGYYSNWNVGAGYCYDTNSANVYFLFPRYYTQASHIHWNGIDNDFVYTFPAGGDLTCSGTFETLQLG
ncbi:hypothetical protein ACFY1P_08125 [Streptomyces sp. NPDC001407]|uniref:hypothetical protein n=1 Tax=Streptomyces sp. NPDC001407 TaxID=3364573 RepID=UPI0036C2085E